MLRVASYVQDLWGGGGKIHATDKFLHAASTVPDKDITPSVMERACRKLESDTKLRWRNVTVKETGNNMCYGLDQKLFKFKKQVSNNYFKLLCTHGTIYNEAPITKTVAWR
jgi:hypothetical protein